MDMTDNAVMHQFELKSRPPNAVHRSAARVKRIRVRRSQGQSVKVADGRPPDHAEAQNGRMGTRNK